MAPVVAKCTSAQELHVFTGADSSLSLPKATALQLSAHSLLDFYLLITVQSVKFYLMDACCRDYRITVSVLFSTVLLILPLLLNPKPLCLQGLCIPCGRNWIWLKSYHRRLCCLFILTACSVGITEPSHRSEEPWKEFSVSQSEALE